jgi:hypothetical protein
MKPSASDNPRYVLIATLHAQGRSIRSIARQVGLSRSWVHEIVSGLRCDDDADAELARFNVVDDDECTPPFTFVGMDPERGSKGSVERFVDGTGTPCDIVAIWRADRDEQRLPLGYMTDCNRQVLAAGYVRVDRGDGYWQWERRP